MRKYLLLSLSLIVSATSISYAQVKSKKAPAAARKPAASSVTAPVQEEKNNFQPIAGDPSKDNVAIYPFTSASGYDYEYAQSVGNAVESGFVRSTRFNVAERNRFGSINAEERFKEVNTDNVVRIAAKLGAKYIITGHITGANTNEVYSSYDHKFQGYQTTISLSFKIIEVQSSLIKVSESVNIIGSGGTSALAKGSAYASIDGITRRLIAAYFPQRFKFMAVGEKEIKKKVEVLKTFKIWGGSDNGIKPGDAVEIYIVNFIVNPATGKQVEERNNLGIATIVAINSGSTATCEVYRPGKFGAALLDAITKTPDLVVVEYTGGAKPKGFWDL